GQRLAAGVDGLDGRRRHDGRRRIGELDRVALGEGGLRERGSLCGRRQRIAADGGAARAAVGRSLVRAAGGPSRLRRRVRLLLRARRRTRDLALLLLRLRRDRLEVGVELALLRLQLVAVDVRRLRRLLLLAVASAVLRPLVGALPLVDLLLHLRREAG